VLRVPAPQGAFLRDSALCIPEHCLPAEKTMLPSPHAPALTISGAINRIPLCMSQPKTCIACPPWFEPRSGKSARPGCRWKTPRPVRSENCTVSASLLPGLSSFPGRRILIASCQHYTPICRGKGPLRLRRASPQEGTKGTKIQPIQRFLSFPGRSPPS
jgi:hypothetical protein